MKYACARGVKLTHFHQLSLPNTFLLIKKNHTANNYNYKYMYSIYTAKNVCYMYSINISANHESFELKKVTENNMTLPIAIEPGLQHCSSGHLDHWSRDIWPTHPLPHSQILMPCCWILWPCWTDPGQKTHVQLCLLEFKHNILIKTKVTLHCQVKYKSFCYVPNTFHKL